MQDISTMNRKEILDEILGEENVKRKRESFKRSEVYNKRQAPFIKARLEEEFDAETIRDMRKFLSINITKRVTDKMASIYAKSPERVFIGEDEKSLSDDVTKAIGEIYAKANVNQKLKVANRILKYQNQCVLQVIPQRGTIGVRVYQPHQIDVIPMDGDPETPFAYITSAYQRSDSMKSGDGRDQGIADRNDGQAERKKMRFVWWSAEHNFITDGLGNFVGDEGESIENPIEELPFIDVSDEKENEFWVRAGNSIVDFALDFAVIVSDTTNINRLQGYAQGWIKSKAPIALRVGPERFVHLPLVEGDTTQADMGYASPNPDMQASLDLMDRLLNYFLTQEGVDPKVVNSKGDSKTFTSGLDRFLSMLESFEASQDDLEKFVAIEAQVFALICKWLKAFYGTTNAPLEVKASVPDGASVQVNFVKPEIVQSQKEIQESALSRVEAGIDSEVMAVMDIHGMTEEQAIEHIKKVKEHKAEFGSSPAALDGAEQTTDGGQVLASAPEAAKVADTALNGAQVTAMIEVVAQVAQGQIPRESAVAIMEKAFLIPRAEAERLLGSAGKSFKPEREEPRATPFKGAA